MRKDSPTASDAHVPSAMGERRRKNKLKDLMFSELSLVDAGANSGAKVMLMKRDDSFAGARGFKIAEDKGPQGPGHDRWRFLIDEIKRSYLKPQAIARAEAWPQLSNEEKAQVRAEEVAAGQTRKNDDIDTTTAAEFYQLVRRVAAIQKRDGESVEQAASRMFTAKDEQGRRIRAAYEAYRSRDAFKGIK